MTVHRYVRPSPASTFRSSASTSSPVDPERVLDAALGAVAAGSVAAVGDLFDLVGAEVWHAAVLECGDTDLAQQAVVRTFREAWHRPDDVPRTFVDARLWFVGTACRVSRDLTVRRLRGAHPAPTPLRGRVRRLRADT